MNTEPVSLGTDRRPDPDHRPSIRILLAAKLLRDGTDPRQVSDRTHVPLPLVDLLREEATPRGDAPAVS